MNIPRRAGVEGAAALVVILACGLAAGADPWTSGPDAPSPTTPAPYPQAPREPGAKVQVLDLPPTPPDPKDAALDDGIPAAPADPRSATTRTRAQLFRFGAIDPEAALVDVPGLWLFHEQAGTARLLARGLDQRDIDVTLDGVPLFDLGGLVSPLDMISNASAARITFHHGPRALSSSPKGAAGVVDVDTLGIYPDGGQRDLGEGFGLRGVLGAGYGGPDLDKGVFTAAETGYGRARFAVDAALLDREDQRLGRGQLAAGQDPGGLVFASGGDAGVAGARADVVPMKSLHLFTTWQSARVLETPHPSECRAGVDGNGNALDCTRTTERGLDVWIAGGEDAVDVGGVRLVFAGRAHAQHGVAKDERAGTGIPNVERAFDDGVRAGATMSVDAALPPVALGDVWTPRATLGGDVYGDRFTSTFFVRSQRRRDAEPPGDGLPDVTRDRLPDGDVQGFTSLRASVSLEGARATLWAAGRASRTGDAARENGAEAIVGGGTVDSGVVTGELGARVRVLEDLAAYIAAVHLAHDDTVEGGLTYALPFFDVDAVLFGSSRTATATSAGAYTPDDTAATGAELSASLHPGLAGLAAEGTFSVVNVDDGALFQPKAPHPGVVNPAGTVTLTWDPPAPLVPNTPVFAGFGARTRFLLPQQRLSPSEQLDRGLCPELPTDDQLAAGVVQQQPCSGAPGSFAFDLDAHVDVGVFRVDAAALNLLDQQGSLRDEPIGSGGASFRALLTVKL